MHLVTLSIWSSAEITITGRPRSSELAFKMLEHLVSVRLRHHDVERTRSTWPARIFSSASRPFSAFETRQREATVIVVVDDKNDWIPRLRSLRGGSSSGSHVTRRNRDGGMLKWFRC